MDNRNFLNKKGADAFLTSDEQTMWYFTRFESSFGYVVVLPEKIVYITDLRYKEGAEKTLTPKGIEVLTATPKTVIEVLSSVLGNAATVGYQADCVTVKEFEQLSALGKNFVDMSTEVWEQEMVKTDEELSLIKKACSITEKTYQSILTFFKEGMTEIEVATEMEYRMKNLGATGLAFSTIVAFGKNASVPHHVPGNTKLKKGMAILMDFGCSYQGYCSDMTRTVYFGKPDKTFRKAYAVALKAHLDARNAITAGMPTKDADAIARTVIEESEFKGLFTHSLGHGVGVHIHELPNLSPLATAVFAENMVFTDEPGIYKEGKFGIRIEDTLVIKGGKAVSLMKTNKALTYIENGVVKKAKI